MGYNKTKEIIGHNSNGDNNEHPKRYDINLVPEFIHRDKPYPIGRFIVKTHEFFWFIGGRWLLRTVENSSFINKDRNKLIIFFDGTGCAFIFGVFIARIIESFVNIMLPDLIKELLGK